MVLGLSGTAVVNNLIEARKLIELITVQERPDLATEINPANAMRLHQALMANGIRQRAENQFPAEIRRPRIDATRFIEEVREVSRCEPSRRTVVLDQLMLQARIEGVLMAIDGPTVVATQYTDGFIEPLRQAIQAAGYSVGVHTGQEKYPCHGFENAVEAFKAGRVDVLVASVGTMGTGVDGLQHVSSNLMIASMPWTAADYWQLIARLARSGQKELVKVTIPTTFIRYTDEELGPAEWSYCDYRAQIIARKARLMNAVMDGILPNEADISEARANKALVSRPGDL